MWICCFHFELIFSHSFVVSVSWSSGGKEPVATLLERQGVGPDEEFEKDFRGDKRRVPGMAGASSSSGHGLVLTHGSNPMPDVVMDVQTLDVSRWKAPERRCRRTPC